LVLYEMLTARRPFPKTSLGSMLARGTDAVIQPPCQARSRIAGRLNALILALLDRDPGRPDFRLSSRRRTVSITRAASGVAGTVRGRSVTSLHRNGRGSNVHAASDAPTRRARVA
jgi:hypothetical protein